LLDTKQFNKHYGYSLKSGLQKKLERFVNKELPILIEKGIIAGITGKRMTFSALAYPR
jgi:hypothetical protein